MSVITYRAVTVQCSQDWIQTTSEHAIEHAQNKQGF